MDSVSLPKSKKSFAKVFKLTLIAVLVLAISFTAFLHWNSEAIVRKATGILQHQLNDTMYYADASLQWIRFFPNVALQFQEFTVGLPQKPLVDSGHVSVIFGVLPLLSGNIIVKKLQIEDARINVVHNNGKWSFDLLKEKPSHEPQKADVSNQKQNKGWNALLHQLVIKNSFIHFHDGGDLVLNLQVTAAEFDGALSREKIEAQLRIEADLYELGNKKITQSRPLAISLDGAFIFDPIQNKQEINNWKLETNNALFELDGDIQVLQDRKDVDLEIKWNDEHAADVLSILTAYGISRFNGYDINGMSGGKVAIKGALSESETPRIELESILTEGRVRFPSDAGIMKNILADVKYDSGDKASSKNSFLMLNLREGSFQGKNVKADIRVTNLAHPVVDANLKGHFASGLLNLVVDSSSWYFQEGSIQTSNYTIKQLPVKNLNAKTFIEHSFGQLEAKDLQFTYHHDRIRIKNGNIELDIDGAMQVVMDEFVWNNAIGEDIKGEIDFSGSTVDFDMSGRHSKGHIEAKGIINGFGNRPVLDAQWTAKNIDITALLSSFENFGQSFITSSNLDGNANVWSHSIIPYDANGNIRKKEIYIRTAIDIKNGRLKNLKTLEDFGKYIHLDDLRDIRFSEMRNYMKIENEQIYLPVMFIQSSAINLSVNGVHSFDHKILYHFKINAGQAATDKLKKSDPFKRLKKARKSGWINFYYVIDGTVENPEYEQSRDAVISSFEQSSSLKVDLRNDLVRRFGHDIYWLEPNEWEDIPEYK